MRPEIERYKRSGRTRAYRRLKKWRHKQMKTAIKRTTTKRTRQLRKREIRSLLKNE